MNKIKIFGMGLAALALASCSTPQKPAVDTAKPVVACFLLQNACI